MKKIVLITEICSAGENNEMCYYDLLPSNVKSLVDKSLKINDDVSCDIYKDGLQYLYRLERKNKSGVFVPKGTNGEYMGQATIYHYSD